MSLSRWVAGYDLLGLCFEGMTDRKPHRHHYEADLRQHEVEVAEA